VKGSESVYMYNIKSYFSGQAPPPDVITLTFENQGPKITIQIVQTSDRFRYSCAVNGKPVKEIVRQMNKDDDDNALNDFVITIPEVDIARRVGEEKEGIVWYTIYTFRISENRLTKCRRRFSHFHDLHTDISSTFACSHLQTMLPTFPSRSWKLFVDHLA
jgi:hypothetical protein